MLKIYDTSDSSSQISGTLCGSSATCRKLPALCGMAGSVQDVNVEYRDKNLNTMYNQNSGFYIENRKGIQLPVVQVHNRRPSGMNRSLGESETLILDGNRDSIRADEFYGDEFILSLSDVLKSDEMYDMDLSMIDLEDITVNENGNFVPYSDVDTEGESKIETESKTESVSKTESESKSRSESKTESENRSTTPYPDIETETDSRSSLLSDKVKFYREPKQDGEYVSSSDSSTVTMQTGHSDPRKRHRYILERMGQIKRITDLMGEMKHNIELIRQTKRGKLFTGSHQHPKSKEDIISDMKQIFQLSREGFPDISSTDDVCSSGTTTSDYFLLPAQISLDNYDAQLKNDENQSHYYGNQRTRMNNSDGVYDDAELSDDVDTIQNESEADTLVNSYGDHSNQENVYSNHDNHTNNGDYAVGDDYYDSYDWPHESNGYHGNYRDQYGNHGDINRNHGNSENHYGQYVQEDNSLNKGVYDAPNNLGSSFAYSTVNGNLGNSLGQVQCNTGHYGNSLVHAQYNTHHHGNQNDQFETKQHMTCSGQRIKKVDELQSVKSNADHGHQIDLEHHKEKGFKERHYIELPAVDDDVFYDEADIATLIYMSYGLTDGHHADQCAVKENRSSLNYSKENVGDDMKGSEFAPENDLCRIAHGNKSDLLGYVSVAPGNTVSEGLSMLEERKHDSSVKIKEQTGQLAHGDNYQHSHPPVDEGEGAHQLLHNTGDNVAMVMMQADSAAGDSGCRNLDMAHDTITEVPYNQHSSPKFVVSGFSLKICLKLPKKVDVFSSAC